MSNIETPEARELSLVGKVEMRIAMANDATLSKTLNTYLTPLLLKLASDSVNVRNKVISVCQHINTRVKPPSIKLPVAALLRQYKDNHNSLVRHFDLLYIQQGIDRLSIPERLDLLPTFIHGLRSNAEESATHAASIFNLFLKVLHSMKLPERGSKEDIDLREKLELSDKDDDAVFVATWIGKLILFGPGQTGATRCPGLTTEDCRFLQLYGKKETWTPNAVGGLSLVETKVVSAKFLASGAFSDTERFLPALFASADPNSRLSDIGDDILKRATSAVSLEDPVLVQQLYEIYLGTRGAEGSLPARSPLQTKILTLLCKSKLASSFVPQSIQIVREGLSPHSSAQHETIISTPKQGLEASKLRGQIFAFTNWLARISSPADLNAFAPGLVTQLRTYIENQGWPRYDTENAIPSAGELTSRAFGYESIGLLAGACADKILLEPKLDLLQWLFVSLSEDASSKDVSFNIEQALSSVLRAFAAQSLNSEIESSLTSMLLHHMGLRPSHSSNGEESNSSVVRSTRFVAVRFANRCLPYRSATARWIDILAIDGGVNERSEEVEEGRKGLDPYWYRLLNPLKDDSSPTEQSSQALKYDPPDFPELMEKVFGPESLWDVAKHNSGTDLANAYMSALTFCRFVLLQQALTVTGRPPAIDGDWERNIDALVTNDEDTRNSLKEYFGNYSISSTTNRAAPRALKIYLQASYNGIISSGGGDANRGGDFLLELCSLLPNAAYLSLSASISSLREPIFSTKKASRESASHVFGLLTSLKECPDNKTYEMLKTFEKKIESWRQAIGSEILQVHGSVLATAYFLSRSLSRCNVPSDFEEQRSKFVSTLLEVLNDSRDKMLLDAVLVAILELALFSALTPDTIPQSYNVRDLTQKLIEKAKEGHEKAIMTLGNLALQCKEESNHEATLTYIINKLYDLHNLKQPEVQFAVGAALSCAAIGWQSKSLFGAQDIQGPVPLSPTRSSTSSSVLDQVLLKCRTTKPALRQASVIWLLCLVQYCGHMEEIQDRLRECQVAFKSFLADRDSLNQESAARGLALLYDKGNRSLKDDLVRDLISSFTGNNGLAGKGNVSEETELFDAGALPTGDGSITTYKDIMSLAAEVQDPSLVYRFMSLASNNAIWSERAAFGKFGLSNILSDASTDGYLSNNPKIYPALFRYRFDPNTNVRNSMNDIWAAIVKDPAKTIDLHFDSIVNDLLKNILGKEWRVRQASCAAIADLIQGRTFEKYEKYLARIWELTFKVCDDIKESVRGAAMSLARVLTGVLTRGLEAGESSSSAEKMLNQVLPFLLSPSGLESGAPEVQDFSRKTLLKIIKSSTRKTLGPFVPGLVGRLLTLLSSIEPEMINYIHLNAQQYGLTAQELDDARLKHIRGSSMLEAIERCLDFLDEASMPELQQSLDNAIKTVVGLPSKVGCSRVLVTLSTRQNFLFKPYADHFLALALKQVFDRNETISSSYAVACGYLARLSSNEAILKLVNSCQKLYFDSEDDRHRVISGDIVYAMSKHATDRFNSLAGGILPFVFIAKHDISDRVKKLFEDTWSENVGGSRAVLLYLKEIVDLASQHLDSARWSIKHTSAFAVADVVTSSGNAISDKNATMLWPCLEKALSGKTWEGKENILKALIHLAKSSTFWTTDHKVEEQFEKIILRESKRNNPIFRQHALECLGDFAELRDTVDMFPQVLAVTKPIIEETLSGSDEMDIDSESGGPSSQTVTELTLANASTALLKSVNPQGRNGKDLVFSLTETIELIGLIRTAAASRLTLNAIYDGQRKCFDRLQEVQDGSLPLPLESVLVKYVKQLFGSSEQVEQTRLKASEVAVSMAPLVRQGNSIKTVFREQLATARAQERSVPVQQSLDRARKMVGE